MAQSNKSQRRGTQSRPSAQGASRPQPRQPSSISTRPQEKRREKINAARVLTTGVHAPRREDIINGDTGHNARLGTDGMAPLYPHRDGSLVTARHSEAWIRASKELYSSPNNVRYVGLGARAGCTTRWCITGGSTGEMKRYTVAGCSVTRGWLDEYERGDVGLKCLVEPVLSNLEELWIDACLLNCAKNTRAYALYQRVIGLRPGQICKDEEIKHVLEEEIATSVGLRRVEDVFPVMRSIVVFVSAGTEVILPEALEIRYSREARYKLKDLYPGRRVSIGENLPVLVKEFPKLAGCGYAVCPIPSGNIVKFSVGDYKYDERYLEKFREEKIYAVYGRPGDSDASKPKVLPAVEPSTKTDERAELETAIQAMEAAGLRDITIKRALWAYKQEAPQYFMEQTPRLPRDMLEKYKSALA